ncbi:MAG: ATP-binding protein [Streptosporangiaceae bacterium]
MAIVFAETPLLTMRLLGGFHVERAGVAGAVSGWQRRSAKTLTKLLATCPGHTLHREQVLDILWPGADVESALNSFGKALHAARHAFEPDLPRRMDSAYLRLTDAMIALNTKHVVIDADRFEQLAKDALHGRDITAYESALAAYSGELLPEDRYADWCAERRSFLAELRVRLLLGLAEILEGHGACSEAADRLRTVLGYDPTREVVHRQLMRLYAEMGTPDQAVRQFQVCQDVLRRELSLSPQHETVSLYRDILQSRVPLRGPAAGREVSIAGQRPKAASQQPKTVDVPRQAPAMASTVRPFVGRERVIQHLCGQLRTSDAQPRMVLVTGEAGVGKTRLLEELAARAAKQGAAVLSSGRGAHAGRFPCGLFAVALENHAAGLPESKRAEMAHRYPALARFVPSLQAMGEFPSGATGPGDYHLDLMPAVARLLMDLASRQPVLLVLGDLQDADQLSLDLLRYLAQLAVRRRWLMVGAVREEEVGATTEPRRMIEATMREGLCLKINLDCLSRSDCDQLVRAMFAGRNGGDELAEQIYHWSRGNPLFVEELVREIRESASGPAGRPETARVPARVRALTAMRMAALDETLRRVLGLAAVTRAAEISLSDLRTGAAALDPPVSDAALFEVLDRALQIGLLEERSMGYAFRHPLIRAALYEGLYRHRRDQLQDALAQC